MPTSRARLRHAATGSASSDSPIGGPPGDPAPPHHPGGAGGLAARLLAELQDPDRPMWAHLEPLELGRLRQTCRAARSLRPFVDGHPVDDPLVAGFGNSTESVATCLALNSRLSALEYLARHRRPDAHWRLPDPGIAVGTDDADMLRLMLSWGAPPQFLMHSLLYEAVKRGSLQTLRLLLQRNPAYRPTIESVIRLLAAGRVECAEALRSACGGAFPGQDGDYVFDQGVRLFSEERPLATFTGPGVGLGNLSAMLRAAVQSGDPDGVSLVLDAGQRHPHLLAQALGGALRVAVAEPRGGACLRRLLRAAPSPTAADRGLALCDAARLGDPEAAGLLLGPDTVLHADLSAGPTRPCTPLALAAQGGHLRCVRLIAARQALMGALDTPDPGTGRTALHAALQAGFPRCAEALVRLGARL